MLTLLRARARSRMALAFKTLFYLFPLLLLWLNEREAFGSQKERVASKSIIHFSERTWFVHSLPCGLVLLFALCLVQAFSTSPSLGSVLGDSHRFQPQTRTIFLSFSLQASWYFFPLCRSISVEAWERGK